MDHTNNFLHLVNEAKKHVQEISATELEKLISSNKSLILLDVRENDEWVNGHIEHAIHLPRGILERDVEKLLTDKDAEIVAYCSGGYRSVLACESLHKMGYKKAVSLKGGLKDWIASGFPLTDK